MKYATYLKAKDYSMNNVLPAFRSVEERLDDPFKKEQYHKYAEALAYCGTKKIIAQCQGCGELYFNGMYTCKNRYCPVCQRRKSLILFAKVFPKVKELIKQGYYIQMMSFTVKDTKKLKDGLYLLKTAYRILAHDNKEYRSVYENKFIGGIKSLEVKRGKNSKEWHPHFHAIVVKKIPSRDRDWLNTAWEKIVRDLVNASITPIYEDRYYSSNEKLGDIWVKSIQGTNETELVKSVYECIKYIAKFSSNIENDLEEMVDNLYRVRQIESWGIFRGIEKDIIDLENKSTFELKEMVCKQCGSTAFAIYDGITLEELKDHGMSTDLQDFENVMENEYDNGEID